ncbi:MAG: DUF1416 domain-containing protein [Sciscionella sp.]
MSDGCGAPAQGGDLSTVDTKGQTVLSGKVISGNDPVGGAFVRLLDGNGDFTGEVVSSPAGEFRFFAAPGDWTVRALHRSGNGQSTVNASGAGLHELTVTLA